MELSDLSKDVGINFIIALTSLLISIVSLVLSAIALYFRWQRLRRTTQPDLRLDVFEAIVKYDDASPQGRLDPISLESLNMDDRSNGLTGEELLILRLTNKGLVNVSVTNLGLQSTDYTVIEHREHFLFPNTLPMVLKSGEMLQVSYTLGQVFWTNFRTFKAAVALTSAGEIRNKNRTVRKWSKQVAEIRDASNASRKSTKEEFSNWMNEKSTAPKSIESLCKHCYQLLNSGRPRTAIDCFSDVIEQADIAGNSEIKEKGNKGIRMAIQQAENQ